MKRVVAWRRRESWGVRKETRKHLAKDGLDAPHGNPELCFLSRGTTVAPSAGTGFIVRESTPHRPGNVDDDDQIHVGTVRDTQLNVWVSSMQIPLLECLYCMKIKEVSSYTGTGQGRERTKIEGGDHVDRHDDTPPDRLHSAIIEPRGKIHCDVPRFQPRRYILSTASQNPGDPQPHHQRMSEDAAVEQCD